MPKPFDFEFRQPSVTWQPITDAAIKSRLDAIDNDLAEIRAKLLMLTPPVRQPFHVWLIETMQDCVWVPYGHQPFLSEELALATLRNWGKLVPFRVRRYSRDNQEE